MAWLAVSKSGTEYLFRKKPRRQMSTWTDHTLKCECVSIPSVDGYYNQVQYIFDKRSSAIKLPKGTIELLIGKKLTWKDKPFKFDHICG